MSDYGLRRDRRRAITCLPMSAVVFVQAADIERRGNGGIYTVSAQDAMVQCLRRQTDHCVDG